MLQRTEEVADHFLGSPAKTSHSPLVHLSTCPLVHRIHHKLFLRYKMIQATTNFRYSQHALASLVFSAEKQIKPYHTISHIDRKSIWSILIDMYCSLGLCRIIHFCICTTISLTRDLRSIITCVRFKQPCTKAN